MGTATSTTAHAHHTMLDTSEEDRATSEDLGTADESETVMDGKSLLSPKKPKTPRLTDGNLPSTSTTPIELIESQ